MTTRNQLQASNKTFLGRHWSEHNILRRYFDSDSKLSILSFGCSTGEELLSIRALFPGATLHGCDIDWRNLLKTRSLLGQTANIFHSSDESISAFGQYDIILCNSVLLSSTNSSGIESCLWISILSALDEALKDNGIIQIINSNIPFRFHPCFHKYKALSSPLLFSPNFVDQYDLHGNRMCKGIGGAGWSALLHKHVADEYWEKMTPSDLEDIHFQKGASVNIPIDNEISKNLIPEKTWAFGKTSYRTATSDEECATYTEVDVQWKSIGVNALQIERSSHRIWFDRSIVSARTSIIDLDNAEATVFFESMLGKRSSQMEMEQVFSAAPVRSANF